VVGVEVELSVTSHNHPPILKHVILHCISVLQLKPAGPATAQSHSAAAAALRLLLFIALRRMTHTV
jgi:hypothetical protein